ncbi:MAG: hypothetical protein GEU73_09415 [Chloroflexi bacterium]|nr:hypothetical protein [Chloroflexota bacterium]
MTDVQIRAQIEHKERAIHELRGIVDTYAAGEAEVVRAYFAQPRANEEHIEVLLKQIGREIQVRAWMDRTVAMARDLERGVDRHEYAVLLKETAEEVEHYVLLADIAEWLAGRSLEPERLLGYEVVARYDATLPESIMYNRRLPEACRNVDVGREIVEALGPERARELMHLAEGGGGGAFVECARLSGDEFRERLAAAMRSIVRDEMGHGPARIEGYVREWIHSDEELREDARWLDAFMLAHLRVRNEIWGYPLSEERIAAIQRSETAPYDPAF